MAGDCEDVGKVRLGPGLSARLLRFPPGSWVLAEDLDRLLRDPAALRALWDDYYEQQARRLVNGKDAA
jgi:hypothetical protein